MVIAYSFGFRKDRQGVYPGTSNEALAKVVDRVCRETGAAAILQWEIEKCVNAEVPRSLVIREHTIKGKYLDREEVTAQAVGYMNHLSVKEAILVAHPFLHRRKCKKLLEQGGIKVVIAKTGRVPFDTKSEQWWTRGPLRLLLYAVLQLLFGPP